MYYNKIISGIALALIGMPVLGSQRAPKGCAFTKDQSKSRLSSPQKPAARIPQPPQKPAAPILNPVNVMVHLKKNYFPQADFEYRTVNDIIAIRVHEGDGIPVVYVVDLKKDMQPDDNSQRDQTS